MSTYTLSLADPRADHESVGGKGVSLARLTSAGFPVPNGFHVTTDACRAFVEVNGLQKGILAILEDADPSLPASLETASAAIGSFFADAPLQDRNFVFILCVDMIPP